jgi:acetaldehyde dehydrogenase / alcohol dehydrogenase
MHNFQELADQLLEKASMAAGVFNLLDQEQVDMIVENVYKAGFARRVSLAKMAIEETQLGVLEHKIMKNTVATHLVYDSIKDLKTVGILSKDTHSGITEIAQPLGPVFAVIPMTNPTSTIMYKILICLKTRNPVIISPPRKARECSIETARICYEAALEAGAPENCIQWIEETSRELTKACMTDDRMALILATGGTGLVHAAYSSGTPALGVGPGNVPVFIAKSADIPFAVENIIDSKTFDNGTICASEQSVILEKAIAAQVKAEFEKQNCYFLDQQETEKLEKIAYNVEAGVMNGEIVGQSVKKLAEMSGITVPEGTKILLAPLEGVGPDYPLSNEILAPILAFYVRDNYEEALKTCIDLNYLGGIGHSASIYANDQSTIDDFSELMNAGRILVNTPSAHGAVGGIFNPLLTSFTLGCGAGGKNITTENISAVHLINIKRICRRREDNRWFKFDQGKFLDEKYDADTIMEEYNHNY